jgi:uncharacterized membrane protein YfcA
LEDLTLVVALVVGATALFAAVLGGVTGMSTGIVALPVLAFAFGVRDAVPIVTIAMLFNTASRAWANWEHIDFRVVAWYSAGAVPAAAIGGVVFANAPAEILARGLGIFLLVLVAWRHIPLATTNGMPLRGFAPVGVGQGFFSALFGGAGPFGAHFYLSYGLVKNAFVGTVAVSTFLVSVSKTIVYSSYTLVDAELLAIGVAVGLIMAVGAYIGSKIVRHVPDRAFAYLVEGVMVVAGLALVLQGGR